MLNILAAVFLIVIIVGVVVLTYWIPKKEAEAKGLDGAKYGRMAEHNILMAYQAMEDEAHLQAALAYKSKKNAELRAQLEESAAPAKLAQMYARDCAVNTPLRPLQAVFSRRKGEPPLCTLHVKAYAQGPAPRRLAAQLRLYGADGEVLWENTQPLVEEVCSSMGGVLEWAVPLAGADEQQVSGARYFDAFLQVVPEGGEPGPFAGVSGMARPLSWQELLRVKTQYGADAFAWYEKEANGTWTCVCGKTGNQGEFCTLCRRTVEESSVPPVRNAPKISFLENLASFASIKDVKTAYAELQPTLDADTFQKGSDYINRRLEMQRMYGKTFGQLSGEDVKAMTELLQ